MTAADASSPLPLARGTPRPPAAASPRKGVFLDRDGVLIEEKHYLHRPEDVVLFPGVGPALGRLQRAGFLLFIVTNQSGIGRGYYTLAEMEAVHRHLEAELGRHGARLARIYYAPEAPEQPSRGRKPSPEFLFDARNEFGLDLSQCYMIGDKLIDLECGWNAGVKRSLLVRTGYGAETETKFADKLAAAQLADHLPGAVEWILSSI